MTCIVGVAKNGKVYNGEMLNVGSDSKPHWVSKQVWDIVMNVSEKYYPKTKKE